MKNPRPAPVRSGTPWGAASRFLIGAVLLYSGVQKAASPPEEFAAVIEFYRIIPESYSVPFASVLPFLEILLGLSLVSGYLCRKSSLAAGAMFLMFIAALGSTILRGIPLPDCGCFGKLVHLSSWQALGLDSGLVVLSYLAYRAGGLWAPLDAWVERGTE